MASIQNPAQTTLNTAITIAQFFIYIFPVILTVAGATVLAMYSWRQKNIRGSVSLGWLMLLIAFWSLGTGLMVTSPSREIATTWYWLRQISITTVPTVFLLFTLQYTKRSDRFTLPQITLLFLVPFLTMCIIAVNPGLFTQQVFFRPDGPLLLFDHDLPGGWFYIHLLYTQASLLVAIIILVKEAIQSRHVQQKRYIAILLSLMPPITVSAFLAVYIDPLYAVFSPLAFLISGLAIGWAVFRYHILELVPIAHKTLINNMTDGVLVLDENQNIAHINPVAEEILSLSAKTALGQASQTALQHHPIILEHILNVDQANTNFEIQAGEHARFFDTTIIPIFEKKQLLGKLVTFRDSTETINAMLMMEDQYKKIQSLQAALQEQAIRDSLTGLYNRRHMLEFLEKELARATREKLSFSLVMIDADHFKKVNDSYGHGAGDSVLKNLADLLTRSTRKSDVVCRYGGEEFLVLMPDTSSSAAHMRAEEWRRTIEQTPAIYQDTPIPLTISSGISSFPTDGANADELLNAADSALYLAKNSGRNRVVIYHRPDIAP